MSGTLIATIAGLITAFCWGTSDYLSAKSTAKLKPFQIYFDMQVVSMLIIGGLFLVSGIHISNPGQVLRIAGSSFLTSTAFLIFVKALVFGDVGIIVPLGNIYPLFTIILSVIFLSTNFAASQIVAMIGIVLGAVILAYKKNHKKLPLHQLHKQTILALIAAVVWGFGFFILSPVVSQVSWQSISIVSELFAMVYASVLILVSYGKKTVPAIKESFNYKLAFITGIVGEIGMIVFYLGSSKSGNVVIPTVLSAGGPLVASVWAAIIDKEKLGLAKRIGAGVVVAGIVVLNAT